MLTKYDERYLKQYSSQLQMPKWKFILVHGISWAVMVMVIVLPLEYFVFNKGSFTIPGFFIDVVIWLLGGVVYGWWSHWYLTRKCEAIQKKLTETDS